jgi:hypothetical protein
MARPKVMWLAALCGLSVGTKRHEYSTERRIRVTVTFVVVHAYASRVIAQVLVGSVEVSPEWLRYRSQLGWFNLKDEGDGTY